MHMNSKTALKVGLFLRVSRLAAGYGQEQLAELVKVSQPTVSRWERGKCLPDRGQIGVLGKLYGFHKFELGLLYDIVAPNNDHELGAACLALERSTMDLLSNNQRYYETTVPYYAQIAAGIGEFQEQMDGPHSQLQIPREIYERDSSSYALRVVGDSMEPMLREGDVLVVSPLAALSEGCIVAACVEPEGDIVKVYHHSDDGTVVLKPLNPAYPEIKLAPGNGKKARIWGRVVLQQREL